MDFHQRETVKGPILDFAGSLRSNDAAVLGDVLEAHLSRRSMQLLLNLSDVPYVDEVILGVLNDVHAKARTRGVAVKLCGLQQRVRDKFAMTGMLAIFGNDILPDVPQPLQPPLTHNLNG